MTPSAERKMLSHELQIVFAGEISESFFGIVFALQILKSFLLRNFKVVFPTQISKSFLLGKFQDRFSKSFLLEKFRNRFSESFLLCKF